jgi:transcriptional regulator with XRE-family HTH domain
LVRRLKSKKFRDEFFSSRVDAGLAFQIRTLRQKEGWTQEELARRLGTSQNAVCRLESSNYGKPNVSTLKKVASVFDVALVVRFVKFSALVNDVINLSTESVIPDSFRNDTGLNQPSLPAPAFEVVPISEDNALVGNTTLVTAESANALTTPVRVVVFPEEPTEGAVRPIPGHSLSPGGGVSALQHSQLIH